jgi:hypothetical protein
MDSDVVMAIRKSLCPPLSPLRRARHGLTVALVTKAISETARDHLLAVLGTAGEQVLVLQYGHSPLRLAFMQLCGSQTSRRLERPTAHSS